MQEGSVISQIIQAAAATSMLEWLAFILSIAYVILAARENRWCWPVGLVSVIITFIVYIDPNVRLYSEATLQVYYMIISLYGWIMWSRNRKGNVKVVDSLVIKNWSMREHFMAVGLGTLLLFALGYFWSWMGAALPYVDAFTTAFAIIATYMVTQKVIENWIYFIIVDVVGIFVNWNRGLYLFAILFVIYTIIAVFGYLEWRRKFKTQLATTKN